ncbi:tetratricopeptide repeat-containing sulfotransferase family protein [Phenylobacterium sp.]|uniref:tetratricopeptide repeat-containing sulfotransferase family protein n=1 Tax=Phenylobacterium sp. TaxID=1871053 RepID=UPI002DE4CEDD|nr:sulfotransferase [Phenylobacterium sp.]
MARDRQPLKQSLGSDALARGLDAAAAHFAAGRLSAAAGAYRRLERQAPGDLRATYSLAVIDIRLGEPARARRRLEQVVGATPDHAPALHNLGAVCQQLGDWPAAAQAYGRAAELRPEAVETRRALATALAILGRTDEAIAQHRILARTPAERWAALTRIALLDPGAIDDDDLAAMGPAADDPRLDAQTRTGLLFALGEALDARGQGDAAFDAYAAGNRLKHATLAPHAAEASAVAARHVRETVTPGWLAAHQGRGAGTVAPIFIVGFPRSGSTLIEQILAGHSGVQAMGETGLLPRLVAGGYPQGPKGSAAIHALADRYLAALRERGWDGASRVVDKTLENHLHVGLIHLMFPKAVILHSLRDPVDTGFACFRQLFADGNETLYDLAEIGAEYRRYRDVMAHWDAVLPGRVVEVRYEALVADPEAGIRALGAATGLPWDPAALRFFERERPVATASAVQVRRPIHAGSVARWRRHAAKLAPLIEALGPYGREIRMS